jgi:hypothetical protein
MKLIITIVLLIISVFFMIKYKKQIHENLISFNAPQLSSDRDKESMADLMRLGSQGVENAKYDTVDTRYLH